MRILAIAATLMLLFACKGERPPRDYRDTPPAATHPADSSAEAPGVKPTPEPDSGAGGNPAREPVPGETTTTGLKDQPPKGH